MQGDRLQDFRNAPRVDTAGGEVRLRFFSLANFLEAYSENISEGGMFVATEDYLPEGTRFRIIVELGTQDSFQGFAEVVWLRESLVNGKQTGMGIKFLFLEPEGQQLINRILQHRSRKQG